MKERIEDDIWASEKEASVAAAPKAVGARETFQELPRTSSFRHIHMLWCDACGTYGTSSERGPLVFCQGCSIAYHRLCLGPRNQRDHLVSKVGDQDFVLQCRRCISVAARKDDTAPRQDMCQACREPGRACEPFRHRKTARQEEKEREENGGRDPVTEVDMSLLNKAENVLFRCGGCYRAFHFQHLPSRADPDKMDTYDDGDSLADRRFAEYCKDWRCAECVAAPGKVQGLVAWRPSNTDTYIAGATVEMVAEDEKEYLVKWEKLSYFRATWMPGAWVWGVTVKAMRKAFEKKGSGPNWPKMTAEEAIPEEYLRIDIVLDVRYTSIVRIHTEDVDRARIREVSEAYVKYKGLGYEEVVWERVPGPDDGDRWKDFVVAYEDWVSGRYIHLPKPHFLRERLEKARASNFELKLLKSKQPEKLTGGKMMAYQMEGLNWAYFKWYKGQNAILADEMGLGKTIQVIGLLATLIQDHKCWPFLVVVPNSTCANWRRELKHWAPSLRVVTFFGSAHARKLAMDYELRPNGSKDLQCHIVVTSYETPIDEAGKRFFNSVAWAGLIVDEGQRLKNDKNLLYTALSGLKAPFKLLLTGTPLQNNARELFNLLQFLDPEVKATELEVEYAELTKENVPKLHDLIRPFFLRRTKAQVLTFLPPMAQVIIPVSMTVVQKKLYKSILAKNPELIKSIYGRHRVKQTERHSLNNILMQLRKCLCHPFVYSRAIEEQTANAATSHRTLVEASSKLQLLEMMLPKLQERGHRVLIFSQFLAMLDIVEDFLDGLGLPFQRLDGSTGSLEKQRRIDAYNASGSTLFAFLLSTRAGGVGINLATADTVIILDPDFNPHQDVQALSRAHRIGQKKKVLVFQLMTRDSAEEKIVQAGRKKMALDHILVEQMDATEDADIDLESILMHGAAALFDDDGERDIHYDSASVDKLLDRSQAENTKVGEDNSAESQFSFARIWANDRDELCEGFDEDDKDAMPDPTVWDKILKEREREAARDLAARQETLGRGKRRRQAVEYHEAMMQDLGDAHSPLMRPTASDSGDTDFQARDADEVEEEYEEGGVSMDEISKERVTLGGEVKGQGLRQTKTPGGRGQIPLARSGPATTSSTTKTKAETRPGSANLPYMLQPVYPPPGQFRPIFGPAPTAPMYQTRPLPNPASGTAATMNPNLYLRVPPRSQIATPHMRAKLPTPLPLPLSQALTYPICPACKAAHQTGSCPLKLATLELCPLCHQAHFGDGPACAHLRSEVQVRAMLEALKMSTEDKELKALAVTYLRGRKGHLVRRNRLAAETGLDVRAFDGVGGMGEEVDADGRVAVVGENEKAMAGESMHGG
ncbi:MAG: hypothetical protein M1838_005808 [Thelocarpon superellum]|nr:MAG: hypothetical protein M1838_005808 [Thelocarpon superellum]